MDAVLAELRSICQPVVESPASSARLRDAAVGSRLGASARGRVGRVGAFAAGLPAARRRQSVAPPRCLYSIAQLSWSTRLRRCHGRPARQHSKMTNFGRFFWSQGFCSAYGLERGLSCRFREAVP